jgi:hypothetical protein
MSDIVDELRKLPGDKCRPCHEAAAEIERLRRVELDRSRAELDNNDGLTLTAVRELLARKSTAELVGTLRDLAADYRFELMPAKFRCVMQEAANRLAGAQPVRLEK